ncbi:MAG: hypothetical protein Q7T65_07205 [Thiobacillus sp.]|nr:hypothetical protein [Thiobacillus sp.]
MAGYLDSVLAYLDMHYAEATDGLVEKSPSRLCRGEGTEKNFYILKIDLVNSTQLLHGRRRSTYLKLAHTFLSTMDRIACDHGADGEQTEYAGDSVLAYFPDSVAAEDVLNAACYCRVAVRRIGKLDQTLAGIGIKCKVILHYAPLVVSRIGPRGGSVLTAIGHPIHTVAKMEKSIQEGAGRATVAFYKQLDGASKKYLTPIYSETVPLAPLPEVIPFVTANTALGVQQTSTLPGLLNPGGLASTGLRRPTAANTAPGVQQNSILAGLLNPGGLANVGLRRPIDVPGLMQFQPPVGPEVIRTLEAYAVGWGLLGRSLGIPFV